MPILLKLSTIVLLSLFSFASSGNRALNERVITSSDKMINDYFACSGKVGICANRNNDCFQNSDMAESGAGYNGLDNNVISGGHVIMNGGKGGKGGDGINGGIGGNGGDGNYFSK